MSKTEKEKLLKKFSLLLKFCDYFQLSNLIKEFKPIMEYFKNDTLNIIILGEIKRGKSSFINALTGRSLLPVDITPTTATINILKYSINEKIMVYYSDNKIETLEMNNDVLNKFTASNDFDSNTIKYIEVYLNSEILKNNAVIIDTPGVNDICQTRTEITYGFLPLIDLAIFILDSTQPVSKSESEFIQTQFIKKSNAGVLFTLGKSDRLKENQVDDVIDFCADKLSKILNTPSDIEVIPLSSKLYLKGENNKINQFEKIINKIKNYIETTNAGNRKINAIQNSIKNFENAIHIEIQLHEKILNMSVNEKMMLIENIKQQTNNKSSLFGVFKEYLKLIQTKVKIGIEKSFKNFSIELIQTLQHTVDTFQGNPKDLIEKHLPYNIKMSLKNWVERHQPSLQKGLNVIADQLIIQFQKNLGKVNLIKKNQINITGDTQVNFDNIEICDINAMKKNLYLTSTIMGLAGTFLIGPLALPIALLFNNFFGTESIERKTNEMKNEIVMRLSSNVENCLMDYKNSAIKNIDIFFNQLEVYFSKNFDETCKNFLDRIDNVNYEINEIKNKFETMKLKLNDSLK